MANSSNSTPATERGNHPLNPLTPAEIRAAAGIVREWDGWTETTRFESIRLRYPGKAQCRAEIADGAASGSRRAYVSAYDTATDGVSELIVDLTGRAVESAREVQGARPAINIDEFLVCAETVPQHPDFIAAMAKRGVTDLSNIQIDPFSAGNFGFKDERGHRLVHCLVYLRSDPADNGYAHPVEGLNVLFDLNRVEVVRVLDHGVHQIPMASSNYQASRPEITDTLRGDLMPIHIVQPDGPSFTVEDRVVSWANWRFHVEFHPREGLVLNDIRVRSGERAPWRPLIWRASIAEMVVPYGDPSFNHYRKNAFDVGEYGMGQVANPLKLGCDCRGHIHYFDGVFNLTSGEPAVVENAVCLHEEDDGMLWKHTDYVTGGTEHRRARRLLISMVATVGNYEYGFYWIFHMDGTLELEVKATGIVNTQGLNAVSGVAYGTEVMPGVVAPNHQHLFCARLDMAVDGDANRLVELNVVRPPMGGDNPHGNAFRVEETVIETEGGRRRNADSERLWKVESTSVTNALGRATAYRLHSGGMLRPWLHADTMMARRAAFIFNHVWCTPSDPDQRYPAGRFVNQSDGSDTIATWVKQGRSIRDTDIVLWHTFGILHLPRVEDWPVQPVARTGFRLEADGFFDRNPRLDVPPSA
ncbi:MAG: primary-amine oxidase [Rhodospirillales bacterium]|nr:primary-amine oxidase [Rhodospirillales bacterium]